MASSSRSSPARSPAATMVVLRGPGEAYLLRHTGGDAAISWVEQIDPETLAPIGPLPRPPRRADLARRGGGARERVPVRGVREPPPPARSRHRADRVPHPAPRAPLQQLRDPPRRAPRDQGLRRRAPRPLGPRGRAGRAAGARTRTARDRRPPPAARALDRPPLGRRRRHLRRRRRVAAPRPLGRDGADPRRRLPVPLPHARRPGLRVGRRARRGCGMVPRRRRGHRAVRRHLSRPRRLTGAVAPRARRHSPPARSGSPTICGLPGGVVANPPVVDPQRRIAVGYDSANGVLAAFTVAADGTLEPALAATPVPRVAPDPVPRHRRAGHRRLRP